MATNYLNETYNTNIVIKKVDLSYLGSIQLKDIAIKDHHQDSLINVKNLSTSIFSYRNILDNKLEFEDIDLVGANLIIKTYEGEDNDSFSIFTDKFDDGKKNDKPSGFLLTSTSIHLSDANIKILDENEENNGLVYFKNINGDVNNFKVEGPNISGDIKKLNFVENHGIEVQNLTSNFTYTRQEMKLMNSILETETSKVLADIVFHRNGSFADFNNKVKFDADIKKGDISLIDLNKFYKEFGENDVLHLTAKLSGTLNNFNVNNLDMTSDLRSVVKGDLHVVNAFNTDAGFSVDAKLDNLTSDYNHLKNLLPNILENSLPTIFKEFGKFKITGNTFITPELIDAQLQVNTRLGTTISDLKMTNIDDIDNATYKGQIKIIDFNLGEIAKDSLIGKLSLEADVDGRGFTLENLKTKFNGTVYKHQYKGYTYKNIAIDGLFENKKFNGKLLSEDENLKMAFNGLADFSSDDYKFDFNSKVDYADFKTLNLFTDHKKSILKGDIDMNLIGNSLDDIRGTIAIKNGSYSNHIDGYFFKDFNINSTFKEDVRTITINSSDIVNGKVVGKFKFAELGKLTRNSIGSIYANYNPFPVSKGQYLDFNFKIYNKIVEVFLPKVNLGKNTVVKGSINSDNNKFKLDVKSPQINAYDFLVNAIDLQIDNKNPLFNTQLSIDKIKSKYYDVSDLSLVNATLNDTLFFRTEFKGGLENTESYDLGFYHTIDANNKSVVGLNKSNFKYKNTEWLINPKENRKHKIVFDNDFQSFDIQEFDLVAGGQKISFYGAVYGKDNMDLDFNFKDVILAGITPDIEGWSFAGLINGDIEYKQNASIIQPIANITVEDFFVNDSYQGKLLVDMKGKNSVRNFDVKVSVENENVENLLALGTVDLSQSKPTLDMNIDFEKFKLDLFDPIGGENFTNIRGFAYGSTKLTGLLENPDMEGELFLDSAGMAFPYLNVNYDFEGTTVLELRDQTFDVVDLTLKDVKENTRASLLGTISHYKFGDWKMDLSLNTKNLLVLDTQATDDALYYGKGFIDGAATITGFTDNLTIDVNGKTNPGTYFVIPLSDVKSITNNSLVTFVNNKDETKEVEQPTELLLEKFKGLALNFNLQVTKDAIVEMIMDKSTGSALKGSGTGDLRIEIDTKGKFNMYGDFIVDNGYYDFKYGRFITKRFEAIKGGTVSWDGSPYTANLDIETKYRVDANPKSILENITTTRDIPVDLILRFTGELYDTKKEYDINIPDAGSDVNSELDFKINQSNDKNTKIRHFGSLLAFGTFFSENSNIDDYGASLLSETGEELLSNVITSILGSGNDKFKFGLDYNIGSNRSDIDNLNTDDQVGISVATKINDRILIDGKVGVPVGSSQQAVKGEVEIEFLLNEEGTLRSTVFNRQNEIQYTEEEEGYTQGVGLSYQFDFDNGGELLEKLGLKKKKEKEKDTVKKPKDTIKQKPLLNFNNFSKKKDSVD